MLSTTPGHNGGAGIPSPVHRKPALNAALNADSTSDPTRAHVAALNLYPIKSCAGIALEQVELVDTGFDLDRSWMVVDSHGDMLTQREHPRLALVHTAFKGGELVLRAPGMLALHLKVDTVEERTRVRVFDDVLRAYDMGALPAQWFSDFLGQPGLRLARFDPEAERLSDAKWTGELKALNTFNDGFPMLVTNTASLADLNTRLLAQGASAITMARFRPNLVLEGLPAWEEDHLHEIDIDTGRGTATLRLVKPCVRCSIPDVDPATATTGTAVAQALAGFRSDKRMGGGVTFGINAVLVQGEGLSLQRGQAVALRHAFA